LVLVGQTVEAGLTEMETQALFLHYMLHLAEAAVVVLTLRQVRHQEVTVAIQQIEAVGLL
jgi:positive regulator of sigma E activity